MSETPKHMGLNWDFDRSIKQPELDQWVTIEDTNLEQEIPDAASRIEPHRAAELYRALQSPGICSDRPST